jgi:class 3 adenylate cyclase
MLVENFRGHNHLDLTGLIVAVSAEGLLGPITRPTSRAGLMKNGAPDQSRSERRYLTIVFVDLVGYTQLSEDLDPEDLLVLQRRYRNLAVRVMEDFGGFVAQFTGDGILVYFGYPTAHENDAERALRASLELIERLRTLDTRLPDATLPPLEARRGDRRK